MDEHLEAENISILPEVIKQKLKDYIEERLKELPTKSDPYFPDIQETEEISIIHDEVSAVKFFRIELDYTLSEDSRISNNYVGIRLKHRRREDLHSQGELRDITTDLYFVTPPSPHEGTVTDIRKPDGTLIEAIENSGGSYELVLSVLKSLHQQYPERFPGIDFLFDSPQE